MTRSRCARRGPLLRVLLLALLSPALLAGPAAAATATGTAGATETTGTSETSGTADTSGFRFWGYFHLAEGEWAFAETGPGDYEPADGDVEGWRYAAASADDPRFPRATPAFEDVCGATEAGDGEKRVAVVIDFGRPADGEAGAAPPQPRAGCAVVDAAATGADALAAVAEVRADPGGLTCALDGYPAQGCGDPVAELPPEAQQADEPVDLAGLAGDSATPGPAATDGSDAASDDAADTGGGPGAATWVAVAVLAAVAALGLLALRRRRAAGGD